MTALVAVSFTFIVFFAFSEKALQGVLNASGLPDVAFEDIAWSAKGAIITDVRLPSLGLTLDKVSISGTPATLAQGRLGKVAIDGFSYTPLPATEKTAEPLDIAATLRGLDVRASEITFINGRVVLSPALPPLLVDGAIHDRGVDYEINTALKTPADQSAVVFAAALTATLTKTTGALRLDGGFTADALTVAGTDLRAVNVKATGPLEALALTVTTQAPAYTKKAVTLNAIAGIDPANGDIFLRQDDDATPLDLTLTLADKPVQLTLPVFAVTYKKEQQTLALSWADLTATLPEARLSGGTATLELSLAPAPVVQGTVKFATITSRAKPALFTPLAFNATLSAVPDTSATTAIEMTLMDPGGTLMFKAQGSHNAAAKTGRMRAQLVPLDLQPGVRTLAEFFPVTDAYVTDVTGTLAAMGGMAWQHDEAKGWTINKTRGRVLLKDVGGAYAGDFPFAGVATVIAFDSLMPLSFTRQQIAIGAFTAGLPLQKGLVTLSLKDGKVLSLQDGQMEMAGGTVTVAPFSLDLTKREGLITLNASNLDMRELFALAPMEGLSATGQVNGTLPLRLTAGKVTLDNGLLTSTGPGVLRYSPREVPAFLSDDTNQHIVDLRTALANFNYASLSMGLRGDLLGQQTITLTIEGNNPDFYSGHPVKLNLNVEGPLQNILRYAPGTSTIPDTIEKQLEQFEGTDALSEQP